MGVCAYTDSLMVEVTGNLWTFKADFRVITTNGDVNRFGRAVMGRGCAYEATQKFPGIADTLGRLLQRRGNHVHFIPIGRYDGVFTFPVKHHWNEQADLALIAQSTSEFRRQVLSAYRYVMPRPGCGNGHLDWSVVRPLLVELPNNVHVIDFA